MDHTSPPPYSETDLFSNTNTTILTPTTTEADDASRVTGRVRSNTSSSEDSLIYTPPYSPTEPDHQHLDHNSNYQSANNYFESRSIPPHYLASSTTQHKIRVTPRSTPDDIPIPPSAADYGITQQDWSTFLNYLLPNHTLNANNDVADRKLKAELIDERMHRLTLNEHDRSRLDINEVQAQLRPLRQPIVSPNENWVEHVNEAISIWNEGFFIPRGLKIVRIDMEHLELRERENRMPGSWIQDEEESHIPERSRGRRGMFNRHSACHERSRGFRMGSMVANDEGFRIGENGLVADSNGFRIGTMLVADANGLRVGGDRGFVADDNGVSIGGRRFGGWGRGRGRGGLHAEEVNRGCAETSEGWHGRNRNGRGGMYTQEMNRGWAPKPEGWYERKGKGRRGMHTQGYHQGSAHGPEEWHRGRPHSHHGRNRRRERDHSSSSSSSSSISDSDASVGSLPDYDHLKDQQLPAAKETLIAWLNHPEYPMTKQTVQNMNHDIKSAKNNHFYNPTPPSQDELVTLRKEVKDLLQKFKDERKSQKKIKKILRKEQRGREKAHRKERKDMRKAGRKAAKKDKKHLRRGDFQDGSASIAMPNPSDLP